MPRSHPPTLITLVRRTLLEECGPLKGQCVLAAVSGGGDSQAMLSVLARLVAPDVLLPVMAKMPLPSEARPPAAQIASPFPRVAQPPFLVGSLVSIPTTQP